MPPEPPARVSVEGITYRCPWRGERYYVTSCPDWPGLVGTLCVWDRAGDCWQPTARANADDVIHLTARGLMFRVDDHEPRATAVMIAGGENVPAGTVMYDTFGNVLGIATGTGGVMVRGSFELEAVGQDWDGAIRPIGELR